MLQGVFYQYGFIRHNCGCKNSKGSIFSTPYFYFPYQRITNQHIKGFRALGADVRIEHGLIITDAEHLRGSHVYLDVVSVGATINVMMAEETSAFLYFPSKAPRR